MSAVYEVISSSLGEVLVAEIDGELAALFFVTKATVLDRVKELSKCYPSMNFIEGHTRNQKNLTKLLNGDDVMDNLPISELVFKRCSDFRKAVYKQLLKIPRGCTISYAEVARRIGRPTAYRAVAQACGANILCVIIPCHRVVASDGTLHGYSAGLDLKQRLLKMESSQLPLKE
ncbi:Methylated-DNA--protein-cysteine methyltransferase [Trichostrongylus colubriformis]|uniref:Methylated-DNA--protein-cysteine methyltransferase n=1 Tax=Trichostrongylus colubriformis TaxID=6319 RepID=A0AAN8IY04_TRICO